MSIPFNRSLPALRSALAAAGLSALLAASPALAQEFCSEPLPPVCADMSTSFDDETLARQCHQDVVAFAERLDEYEACVVGQIETRRGEAAAALERLEDILPPIPE